MIIYVCGHFSFYTSIVSQISSWLWTVLQIVLSYLIQTFKKPILLLLLFLFLCVFSCNLVDAMHKCNTVYYQFLYCRRDSNHISGERGGKRTQKRKQFLSSRRKLCITIGIAKCFNFGIMYFSLYVWLAKFWKMAFLWSSLGH